jgi:hypothetical protein
MNLDRFIGLDKSELEDACQQVVRKMRSLINHEDLEGIVFMINEVEKNIDYIHASISFSVVTMARMNILDPKITLKSELLREVILSKVH